MTVPMAPRVESRLALREAAHVPVPADHHHRKVTGGGPRAAVFGASDGLLTNVSLILGVAGANPGPGIVRLAGIAGLVAGAFSMAAGEYVSMSAQTELIERELAVERSAQLRHPEAERSELAAIYVARGVRADIADEVATALMRDPETALEVHAREELGIDPASPGSPAAAASWSLLAFAVGALLPLLPWFVTSGAAAVIGSLVIGAIASASLGIGLAAFTGRPKLRSAARQLGIAVIAAAVTYAIGHAVGVSVA